MPAEKFYLTGQTEGDGREPDLTIAWGNGHAYINGHTLAEPDDVSGISRLIRALKRAREHVLDH